MLSKKQIPNAKSTSITEIAFDDSRFLGVEQEGRFIELENRRIGAEKRFSINMEGDHGLMAQQLELRKWGTLINPQQNLNHDVVWEFYANVLSSEGETFSFT